MESNTNTNWYNPNIEGEPSKYYRLGQDLFVSIVPYKRILPLGVNEEDLPYLSDEEKAVIFKACKYEYDPRLVFKFDGKERLTFHVKFSDIEIKTFIGVMKKLREPWYKRLIKKFKSDW